MISPKPKLPSAEQRSAFHVACERREDHLGYALKQAHQLMRAAIENRARSIGLGLTFPHMAALFLLLETPGLSGAQLARWAMVSPQTMNQILTRLESDGLIIRERDPEHGRILRARVTERGSERFLRGCQLADTLIDEAQADFSPAERSELLRLLGKCQNNLLQIARAEKAPIADIEGFPAAGRDDDPAKLGAACPASIPPSNSPSNTPTAPCSCSPVRAAARPG